MDGSQPTICFKDNRCVQHCSVFIPLAESNAPGERLSCSQFKNALDRTFDTLRMVQYSWRYKRVIQVIETYYDSITIWKQER